MIDFEEILAGYPPRLRGFRENIIKEYLQYKILDIIFSSKFAAELVFLGGTAIRVTGNGVRFSEDLDFDNRGLTQQDFQEVSKIIEAELTRDGYEIEMKNIFKGAYHCYIKFPSLLFQQGLSGHVQQKILIQIDAEPQDYQYKPDKFLINRFGLFRYINVVPLPLLLSQKVYACLNRARAKGRDFFDVVFLMSKVRPDYDYLMQKARVATREEMVAALKQRIKDVDMKQMAADVAPFLFDATQADRVMMFSNWLETISKK